MTKKIILLLSMLLIISTLVYAKTNKTNEKKLEVPKNVKVLSQSCAMVNLYITVIDLDNNEIVVLQYRGSAYPAELIHVIRTGMIVDPKKQLTFLGTDAPFEKD